MTSEIARFVAAWLADAGLEVDTVERGGRPSVVGVARSLMLNAHLDTVGVDAIAEMGPILVALVALDRRLGSGVQHPLLGTGSLHASLIEGGEEMSSFPARCLLTGERRTLPGETDGDVERELREAAGDAEVRVVVSQARSRSTRVRSSCGRSSRPPASVR